MNILVLAAHPDDEVLGMGGTIKKYTENYNVDKKIISQMNNHIEKLIIDAKSASKTLGVSDVEFLDFPDNEMDLVSNLEITKRIEKIIKKFQPDQVFTHSCFDVNVDHRM